jgi:hypothetical protein
MSSPDRQGLGAERAPAPANASSSGTSGHASPAAPAAPARKKKVQGIGLKKHLEALRLADLKDVHAFWLGEVAGTDLPRRELLAALETALADEALVYRRVKTLTRKVLDVLLLLLRREGHASDLPGLFRRLPGEESVRLEYHEAEAGLRALVKRGFLAELAEAGASTARVVYALPHELAELLNALFREETRTIAGVLRLADHLRALSASERGRLRQTFPALLGEPDAGDAARVLGTDGAPGLTARLGERLARVVDRVVTRHGGLVTRSEWSQSSQTDVEPWSRGAWSQALEAAGVGTVARLSLGEQGLLCDDEVLVVFDEVLADLLARRDAVAPPPDTVVSPGPDLYSDLCWFLEHVKRVPVKTARDGEVYKAGLKRIQDGFVSRETSIAGPAEVWAEVRSAAEHLALVSADAEGFLQVRPEAERFVRLPLEKKAQEVYRLSVEQPGPAGRSLHQHELRGVVADLLRAAPTRWWNGRALVDLARHQYLGELESRGIRERFRDRFFSAWFSGRETLADLTRELERTWLSRLYLFGLLDAAFDGERVRAWRLSALGARVLGVPVMDQTTGLKPLRVNPDFEIVVLPEGDVSDVIHRLDGFAPRTKSGEVVHFRLTREGLETAVMGGRKVEDLLAFLEARSLGGVPQNVAYTLHGWAQGVSFATLERGVVLRANDEQALERILAVPGMDTYVLRRLSPREAFLREEPQDRKLLALLREQGVQLS